MLSSSELGYESLEDFVVVVWEHTFMKMAPHNALATLWTGQSANISTNLSYDGDFDTVLKCIKALDCVMPGSTGLFCMADDNEYDAKLINHPIKSFCAI